MSIETLELQYILKFFSNGYSGDCYIESHKVVKGKLSAGIPLSQEGLKGMMKSFEKGLLAPELLPANVLVSMVNKIIWWNPESYHQLYFVKDLEIPNGCVWLPPLIFKLEGSSLSVVAFKGKERPTYDTKLYQAPFHNIGSDGDICMGSARVKKGIDTVHERIQAHEAAFWMSEFSHLMGGCPTKTNLNILYNRLIGTKKKFPKRELKPVEKDYKVRGWI